MSRNQMNLLHMLCMYGEVCVGVLSFPDVKSFTRTLIIDIRARWA